MVAQPLSSHKPHRLAHRNGSILGGAKRIVAKGIRLILLLLSPEILNIAS